MAIQILDSATAPSVGGDATRELPAALVERMVARSADGLILLAKDGSLLYVNDAAGKAFDRSREELIGLRLWELSESLQAADWIDYWKEVRRRGQCVVEWARSRRDSRQGPPIHIEASLRHFDFDGEEYVSLVVRPVSRSRSAGIAAQHARAESESRSQPPHREAYFKTRARRDLEADLGNAIEKRQLTVIYQPIVQLDSGALHGFETLVRWRHPRRGLVPPLDFIPVAEETDLILPIDRFVLEEACRQYRRWTEDLDLSPSLSVSVNFSGRQFADPDLARDVETILDETGYDPRRLIIEITESELMNQPEVAAAVLDDLKGLGVMIAIDDFGTGYSSLGYLHSLPVDVLKIDRSFVDRLSSTDKDREIIRAIITLSHNLGLVVVAEGIETERQRALLLELGCELGQGALFTLALDAKQARDLIAG